MENRHYWTLLIITCLLVAGMAASVSANAQESTDIIMLNVLTQNPTPAQAGDTVDVRVGVENFGGQPVDGLMLEVVPSYPFSIVDQSSSIQDMGVMQPGQSNDNMKIAQFTVRINKDVSAGTYMLKIKRYLKSDPTEAIIFNFPVDVKGLESAEVVLIDKTELVPGIVTPLKFTVNNVGNAPLRDLIFSWSNADKVILPVGSDNTQQIRYLDVGQSVDLDYNVIADPNANPGLYPIDMRLQYLDTINGTPKTVTTSAGLYAGGGTDFDVSFSQSSGGQTSFSVSNIGSNPAYSVSVIVPQQQGWRVSGTNDVIIGNLNKGDYTVASFAIKSPFSGNSTAGVGASGRFGRTGTASGQTGAPTTTPSAPATDTNATGMQMPSTLTVRIQYTDTKGMRQTVDKTVALSPSDVSSGQTGGITTTQTTSIWSNWYLWAAVIVIAFFGWRWYAKRSRQKATAPAQKKR